jgi:ABC-2 type transport system permease protein
MSARRGIRASFVLVRASVLASLQYRADFLFAGVRALFEAASVLLPLFIVFRQRPTIAGWHAGEALLVVAWFTALRSLLDGVIMPSLVQAIEQIRRGTFDFALLRPVDTQLLVSVGKVEVFAASHILVAAGMIAIALRRLHHVPTPAEAGLAILITIGAAALLYSINLIALSVAFYVARIDNLAYLLSALFDAARWPSTVFRGGARVLFTYVLPLGLMTTFPPLALLGRLSTGAALTAVGAAVAALVISRLLWRRALRAYRSGGG